MAEQTHTDDEGVLATAQARDQLDAALDQLARWEATKAAREAELADLEARTGDELLVADEPESALAEVGREVARLRVEIDMAGKAIAPAEAEVEAHRRVVLRCIAGDRRRDADRYRADAEVRRQRTERILDELEAHEGVRFRAMVQMTDGVTSSWSEGGTITAGLLAEAARFEAMAGELEAVAARRDLTEDVWLPQVIKNDPDGPEGTAHRERAQADEARHAARREAEERLDVRRRAWLEARAIELGARRGDGLTSSHQYDKAKRELREAQDGRGLAAALDRLGAPAST